MKKAFISLFAGMLIFGFAGGAKAAVLTFDEFTNANYYQYTGYDSYSPFPEKQIVSGGLEFTYEQTLIDPVQFRIQYAKIGFNPEFVSAGDFTITEKNGSKFDFLSFDLSRGIYTSNFSIQGYLGSELKYNLDFEPTPGGLGGNYNLAWTNIDKVLFTEPVQQHYFVLDNVEYNESPAPEPSSMVLGLMGLGSMLGLRKRNRKI